MFGCDSVYFDDIVLKNILAIEKNADSVAKLLIQNEMVNLNLVENGGYTALMKGVSSMLNLWLKKANFIF